MMMVRLALACALWGIAAEPVAAADLRAAPAPSRLGAVFAAPAAATLVETYEAPVLALPAPRVPGYYGRAGDFAHRNYYGTSPVAIFSRLPYACGFHGYC
jgi:hypothetical protein